MRECGVPPTARTFGWLLRQLLQGAGGDGVDDGDIERGFVALTAMEVLAGKHTKPIDGDFGDVITEQLWAHASLLTLCGGRRGGGLVTQGEAVLGMARHTTDGRPLRWAADGTKVGEEIYVQLLRLTARAVGGGDVRAAEKFLSEARLVDGLLPSIRL